MLLIDGCSGHPRPYLRELTHEILECDRRELGETHSSVGWQHRPSPLARPLLLDPYEQHKFEIRRERTIGK
jgi:hypothetical protein